jgi:hypothetical protein
VFTDFQWVIFHLDEKSPSRTLAFSRRQLVALRADLRVPQNARLSEEGFAAL